MIKRWPPGTLQRVWARLARDRPVSGHVSREAGISFTSPIANRRREVMSLPSCGKVRRVHQHAVSALHNTFSPIGMWGHAGESGHPERKTRCATFEAGLVESTKRSSRKIWLLDGTNSAF
jgi:hypothetical protein